MPTRQLSFSPVSTFLALPVLTLSLSLGVVQFADAADFGRARVLSAQGSPLDVTVPVTRLTLDDDRVLSVRLADIETWARAGLRPPARLNSMRIVLDAAPGRSESGKTTRQRLLRVTSTEPSNAPSVDLLLVVDTSTGSRLVQFSVLFPQPGLSRPSAPTPPAVVVPGRARSASAEQAAGAGSTPTARRADASGPGSLIVRRGQTLSSIADANPVAGADYYQRLVALWQANPDAFIDNNMNLVRAGERLHLPDSNAVRAVDPAEARKIYQQQMDAHAAYRARMGQGAANRSAAGGASGDRGRVNSGAQAAAVSTGNSGERLRLSEGSASDAEGDRQAAEKLALADAAGRVDRLNRNVEELNRLNQVLGGGQIGASKAAAVASSDSIATQQSPMMNGTAADNRLGQGASSSAPNDRPITNGGINDGGTRSESVAGARSGSQTTAEVSGVSPDAGFGVAGVSSPARADDGANNKGNFSFMASSGLPAWLTDNLLIVVTAILAIIAFIIAWVVRRAAVRNENDTGEDDDVPAPVDTALIDKRLSAINLDLDSPPPGDRMPGERQRP